MAQTRQGQLPQNLTLHVGEEEAILERIDEAPARTELVLTPVELHRRNMQRRLRESQTPKQGVEFADPTAVGERLLTTATLSANPLDRIDRLSMIRAVLADEGVPITPPAVPSDPRTVEQIRTEVESVTGFHPARIDAIQDVAEGIVAPVDADASELVEVAVDIEQALRQRTPKAVSEVESVRRATRELLRSDGELWDAAYPAVERVSLAGISSIPIADIDLLYALLDSTSVPVDIYCRRGTGSFLSRRVAELLDVADPGAVVFES